MAANDSVLADEDGDYSDWIEIHNPDAVAVSLNGWFLTDKADNRTKWTFPNLTLEPGGYLVVFASSKDRRDPAATVHTNFGLSAGGEYLALVKPDALTVVSEFAPKFPAQIEDVSYGVADPYRGETPSVIGYFEVATPGARNGSVSSLILTESVEFDQTSRTFFGTIRVALSGEGNDQQIHYVMAPPSNSGGVVDEPTADSPVYAGPIELSSSMVVRATVFSADGSRHGVVSTEQFTRLDAESVGRVDTFTSQLPLLVLDAHGFGEMSKDGIPRPGWLYGFMPGTDGLARLDNTPDFASMLELEVRGQTSSGYPKKGYKFDLLTAWESTRSLPLFGLGDHDDWNVVAPWNWDPSYIRNALAYAVSNEIGRWAARTQLVEGFVNLDSDGVTLADYAGLFVVTDKPDMEPGRIDATVLRTADVYDESITGGYLLLVDEPTETKVWWTTAGGFPGTEGSVLQIDTPKGDKLAPEQIDYIKGYVQAMEDALALDAESGWSRRNYLEYVDRAAWVDHHLLNVFFKNADAFWRSSYFTKDRGKRLAAGPIWDFDRSMDSKDPRDNEWGTWSLQKFTEQGFAMDYWNFGWWGTMAHDPEFMQAWIDRWQQLRAGPLANGNLGSRVSGLGAEIGPVAAARDVTRWTDNASVWGSFGNEIERLTWWLQMRAGWIDSQFVSRPTLTENGDGQWTVTPPAGATLVYTLEGADPRLRDGRISPDALVAETAVLMPKDSHFRVRAYDPSQARFPGSAWSGALPGVIGAPVEASPRFVNLSSRGAVGSGESILIGGFVVEDADGKTLLIRGAGPALADYEIGDALMDPRLAVFDAEGQQVASNQGWTRDAAADRMPKIAASVGAFAFADGSSDAAVLVHLPQGRYTVHVDSASGQVGTALLELYEVDDIGSVRNLSVRGTVAGMSNPLIAGFVVTGTQPKRVLLRAIGPALLAHGVETALSDPKMILRQGREVVATNDDWTVDGAEDLVTAAASAAGAFSIESGSKDAAMLVTLLPGIYTVEIVAGAGEGGVALAEIYELR